MWTWIALVLGFIIVVILVDEFSGPPNAWRNAHRRSRRKRD